MSDGGDYTREGRSHREAGRGPRITPMRTLLLTLRARDANSREHFVSGTFSVAGDTLTTMTHLGA